jgi:CBS domain-containing protein
VDIPSFLRAHPPFDELDDDGLARVVRATSIEFFPAAQPILIQGGEPARFLYVVRTGSVEVLDADQVVDLHQEGEVFGFVSLLTAEPPALGARAAEETICYLIEGEVAEAILATRPGASFLSRSVRRRELKVLEHADPRVDPWALAADTLVTRAPVTVVADDRIRDVAGRMAAERVSSALVRIGGSWGIVTDRDLRTRVLAEGVSADAPVSEVATTPMLSLPSGSTVGEVLATMLERGIHHVPLADGAGTILGVLTDTDLMALERRSAFQLRYRIERAADAEAAAALARGLPEMVADLVDAGVDALDVAHVATVTVDVLTARLLSLGAERLGEPPAAWAWVALGAQARSERSLLEELDGVLVHAGGPPDDAYFGELAGEVDAGLAAAGVGRPSVGSAVRSGAWRGSVEGWRARMQAWVAAPDGGSAPAPHVADHRTVAGTLEVDAPFEAILRTAATDRPWIRSLARGAIEPRPPRGFLRDAVVEARGPSAGSLDVRGAGLDAITDLARVQALRAGIRDPRTVRRLRALAAAGRLAGEAAPGLEEAFRLLWRIRLEHQASRVRAGLPPDDAVDPRTLGPLVRQALKEAFRLIDRAQGLLALELDLRR